MASCAEQAKKAYDDCNAKLISGEGTKEECAAVTDLLYDLLKDTFTKYYECINQISIILQMKVNIWTISLLLTKQFKLSLRRCIFLAKRLAILIKGVIEQCQFHALTNMQSGHCTRCVPDHLLTRMLNTVLDFAFDIAQKC